MTPEEIIQHLDLEPLSREGGFFAETYRSRDRLPAAALPERYAEDRALATAIYYLLTPKTCSRLHRLASDEIFHFYLGDPVEMLLLHPDGSGGRAILGSDLRAGMRPQIWIPQGVWQGSCLRPGGRLALMGTTVAPGFEYADFEAADREGLLAAYPEYADEIRDLLP